MINPYSFTNEKSKIGFKINLETHNNNHVNSIVTITPSFPDFGIETRCIIKILKEISTIYARLKNQYNF